MPYYGPGTPWHDRKDQTRMKDDLEANFQSIETSSSSTQPRSHYIRTGRGGAGNYGAQIDSADQIDAAADESLKWTRENVSGPNKTYGRGGAGNYDAAIDATNPTDPSADEPLNLVRDNASGSNRTYGRGGLGNHAAAALEDEEMGKAAEGQESKRREKLQLDIEKGVEETLALPEKAKLPLSSPKDARPPS